MQVIDKFQTYNKPYWVYNREDDTIILSEKLVEVLNQKKTKTLVDFVQHLKLEDRSLFSKEALSKIGNREIIFRINGSSNIRFFSSTVKKHASSHGLILGHTNEITKTIQSNGAFETFFENGQTANCILNLKGDILVVNKEFRETFENPKEDLRTKNILDLALGNSKKLFSKYILNHISLSSSSKHNLIDLELKSNDESKIWGKCKIETLQNSEYLFLSIKNITDWMDFKEKNINQEIWSKKFLKALNTLALVTAADKEGRITYANAKFLSTSKFKWSEIKGENHRIFNSGYHPKEFWENVWNTVKQGIPWRGEVRNKTKDNKFYWSDTTINPITDTNGEVIEYLSIRYEITDQKIIESQRNDLLEDLTEYAFLTSHELRGPLARILGLLSLIEKEGDRKEFDNMIKMLLETATDMDQIIKKMNIVIDRNSYVIAKALDKYK